MADAAKYRFDPVDHRFMRLRGQLSPGERLQAMLAAREWVVGAMRSRLTLRYPNLSPKKSTSKCWRRSTVSNAGKPDLSLFLDILRTLERIDTP